MPENLSGHCNCEAVKFTAKEVKENVGACHCSTCRRWGGGPLLAVDCGSEIKFQGEDAIQIYNSSDWAERGFCSKCGSHLFYRLKAQNMYIVPVGLFESQEGFVLDHQVFIDENPGYYCFANETHDMTGPEIFAKFSQGCE